MMSIALKHKSHGFSAGREKLESWAAKGHLFALLDSFFQIPVHLEQSCEKVKLETRDTDPVFFEVIAWDQVTYEPPTLVKLTPEALDWVLNSLSTERWGLFVASQAGTLELARHFQKFVIAKGSDQNPYFLRFHDAAVLEVLLRTWSAEEKSVFFGASFAFGLPDLDSMEIRLDFNPRGEEGARFPNPEDCLISLRDSQLRACSEAIDRDLVKVIYWHLRNHHAKPVQFLDRPTLEGRVQIAIGRARQYGLSTISDLAGFAALMFELAPNFDDHPSFRRILEDPSVQPDVKMRKLSQAISDREWSEAVALFDRSYWVKMRSRR